jgi:hypothetical protein
LNQNQTTQSAGPPGKHIDFGFGIYDYDDRCYELLPSTKYPIDEAKHRAAMVRFAYKLCCDLNITSEFAPFLPDLTKLKDQFNNKWHGIRDFSFKKNTEVHLFLQEISFLFGGHELRTTGKDPIHQVCHMDGEDHNHVIDTNPQLQDKLRPGSFIIPLESERTIYHSTPATLLTVKKGHVLLFAGNLPHGGMTYRDDAWFPAIHGHLDSTHHERTQGFFDLKVSDGVYKPAEHQKLFVGVDFFEQFLEKERQFKKLLREACKREGELKMMRGITTPQNPTYLPTSEETALANLVHKKLNEYGKSFNFCKAKYRDQSK